MRHLLALALLGVLVPARAPAQTTRSPADPGAVRSDTVVTELRSPAGAEFLSGAATAGAWALLLTADGNDAVLFASAAVVFAPALGHAYAGDGRRVARGIATRAGIAASGYVALVAMQDDLDWSTVSMVALAVGSGIVVHSALDISTARASARAYNRRHGTRVWAVPVYAPERGAGAAVAVRF